MSQGFELGPRALPLGRSISIDLASVNRATALECFLVADVCLPATFRGSAELVSACRGAPALLPVGTVPLVEYALRALGGLRVESPVLLLVGGAAAAQRLGEHVAALAADEWPGGARPEVVALPEVRVVGAHVLSA